MDKKERERKNLLEFIDCFPEFKKGEICDFEEPDFLMVNSSTIVGIEIVDYVRGQNKDGSVDRRNEVLRQEISEAAKRQFEKKNKVSLHVSFFWNAHYSIRKTEVLGLAKSILPIVEKHIPSKPYEFININQDDLEIMRLEEVLHSIKIWRNPDTNESRWNITSSGWLRISITEMQSLIDSKNELVESYLRNCDEAELIIIADGHHISSMIDIPLEVINHKFLASFTTVFIFDRIEKKIVSLQLS